MFISYEYKYLGYEAKTNEYRWQYKIIDSGFEEVVDATTPRATDVRIFGDPIILGVAIAVIDIYEKRNLNVAANLMKAIICHSKTYGWTIADLISWNKKWNPKFAKYEKDIEKYMVLLSGNGMNYQKGKNHYLAYSSDSNSWGVVLLDEGWGAYFIPPELSENAGYISSALKIECGFGIVSARGLKPNCIFSSKKKRKRFT